MSPELNQKQQKEIIFLRVRDNREKQERLCAAIQYHFQQKHKILITTPNEEAGQYVNQLLWRSPEESFLPHALSNKPLNEMIVITTTIENLNKASVLFNLCPTASPIYSQFDFVYELLDETHPAKTQLSIQRQTDYSAQNCMVSCK